MGGIWRFRVGSGSEFLNPDPSGSVSVRGGIDSGPGGIWSSLDVGPLAGPSIDSVAGVTSDLASDPRGSDFSFGLS